MTPMKPQKSKFKAGKFCKVVYMLSAHERRFWKLSRPFSIGTRKANEFLTIVAGGKSDRM
jgi:hypothetical protein